MKLFVSQAMSGLSDEEILTKREELIQLAKEYLNVPDLEVIDSFHKTPDLIEKGRVAVLGHSIQLMADADVVIFSENWQHANGCRVEQNVCDLYGIQALYERNIRLEMKHNPLLPYYRNLANVQPSTVYWR